MSEPRATPLVKGAIAVFMAIRRLNLKLAVLDRMHRYIFDGHKKAYLWTFWLCAIIAFGLPFALEGAFWFLPAGLFFILPAVLYYFFRAIKNATSFIFFSALLAVCVSIVVALATERVADDFIFTFVFLLVWLTMSLVANPDVSAITNKVISKISTIVVTVFLLVNFGDLDKALVGESVKITNLDTIFIAVRFFTIPSLCALMLLEIKDYLFAKYENYINKTYFKDKNDNLRR